MTDRDQMIADIERAMAEQRTGQKAEELLVFPVTVQFSHIFDPLPRQQIGQRWTDESFTLTFMFNELPAHLRDWVKVRDWRKEPTVPVVTLTTKLRPTIVPTKTSRCDLHTTLDCARHNHIAGDRLLREARVEVLVRKVEYTSNNPFQPRSRGRLVKALDLCAIRVNVDTMVDTYDTILAELHEEFDGWRE